MKINFNSGDMYALLTAFCWSSAVILFDLSGRRLGAMQINLLKNAVGVELAANTILQKCGVELPEDRLKHENKNG